MRNITEPEFRKRLSATLQGMGHIKAVTGPGRSGAVASVYASHMLGVPFIPYGQPCPDHLRPLLVIDTALLTGATLRKAQRRYGDNTAAAAVFTESGGDGRVVFWYEKQGTRREQRREHLPS